MPQTTRRHLAPAGAGLIVLAILLIPLGSLLRPGPAYAAPAPLAMSSDGRPASERLLALAAALTAPASAGDTTHIRYRTWSMNLIQPEPEVLIQVSEVWWEPDLSARMQDVMPGRTEPEQTVLAAGQMPTIVQGPPAVTPAALATQLSHHDPNPGAAHTITSVESLVLRHHLELPQRQAMLCLLAGVPGLQYRGEVTDRAGRPGDAYTLDTSGGTREILVISSSGLVLAFETIHLVPPPRSPVTAGTVTAYTLIDLSQME